MGLKLKLPLGLLMLEEKQIQNLLLHSILEILKLHSQLRNSMELLVNQSLLVQLGKQKRELTE